MDLRAVRRAVLAILLGVAGCGPRTAAPDAADAPPGGEGIVNPVATNREAAKAGELLFGSMNCDGCHGSGALGFVGPNLVDGRWRYGGSDSAVYQSILKGRPQGMPAYGGLLSEGTIWQLVTYLKIQPVPEDIATEAWP